VLQLRGLEANIKVLSSFEWKYLLRNNEANEAKQAKLTGLYDYIYRNQSYIINYHERDQSNQTSTSQVAESHVESIINARHKGTGKI